MSDRRYISVAEATEIVGCSTRTMIRWIQAGHFDALRFPGAVGYRIDADSFERYLRSRSVVKAAEKELRHG
jgi:excisionase family DNA binding protein